MSTTPKVKYKGHLQLAQNCHVGQNDVMHGMFQRGAREHESSVASPPRSLSVPEGEHDPSQAAVLGDEDNEGVTSGQQIAPPSTLRVEDKSDRPTRHGSPVYTQMSTGPRLPSSHRAVPYGSAFAKAAPHENLDDHLSRNHPPNANLLSPHGRPPPESPRKDEHDLDSDGPDGDKSSVSTVEDQDGIVTSGHAMHFRSDFSRLLVSGGHPSLFSLRSNEVLLVSRVEGVGRLLVMLHEETGATSGIVVDNAVVHDSAAHFGHSPVKVRITAVDIAHARTCHCDCYRLGGILPRSPRFP